MDKQIDTAQQVSLNYEVLRDLLATEVILIGGGQTVGNTY